MILANRFEHNPIVSPVPHNPWEDLATFNGCVIKSDGIYHMAYRALSKATKVDDHVLGMSTVGYAESEDGIQFSKRRQLISPVEDWEKFGCEDPRVTFFEGNYYIFYTALSTFPFGPDGIKIALAKTKDFQTIDSRALITPFNAKAGCLFPERINGKIAMLLTANTDIPPSQIAIAYFDDELQMTSHDYWNNWYDHLSDHALNLKRSDSDHVEIGAPPLKTEKGWLLIYSHIRNYFSEHKIFGVEAVLLDLENPSKIIGRTQTPFLVPREDYELYGIVPNIVFPSGAVIDGETVKIYYGGADTRTCLATCNLKELLDEMTIGNQPMIISKEKNYLERYEYNPILSPVEAHEWEQKAVFNPAAILLDNKVHILYRALSDNDVSTIGYAVSEDGLTISDREEEPIYVPRADFEKNNEGRNFGCEDQRITQIDDRLYITYTAYDGHNAPRVGMSSISVDDFKKRNWKAWNSPILISPPGVDDKNTAILPEKVNGKYMIFHRIDLRIWVDFVDDLAFANNSFVQGFPWLIPRQDKWDSVKIGISAPPIKTEKGWIFTYHGISAIDRAYRVGALLLDLEDPTKIISRIDDPILEPIMNYERDGVVANVVFPCGAVVKDGIFYLYYGGGDKVVGVATCKLDDFLNKF